MNEELYAPGKRTECNSFAIIYAAVGRHEEGKDIWQTNYLYTSTMNHKFISYSKQ